MSEAKVKMTKDLSPPKDVGRHFRMLCMTGKNKGSAYFINGNRVVLGRSQKADIQVIDEKSSREHAELVRNADTYILTDLKSSNGVIVNDVKVIQRKLSDGDKIVIGKVVFRFDILKVRANKDVIRRRDSEDEIEEYDENEKKVAKTKSKKPIIYVAALLCLYLFLFEEESQRKPASPENTIEDVSNNLTDVIDQYTQSNERSSINDEYIHRGQREFREKNYFRAMEEFNMALILDPRDSDAGFYLNKTKQALNNHVKFMFEKGGREYDQLKYSGAIKSYCEIVKLLQKYPDDERYKDAMTQIKVIGKKMGANEEEYQCWEDDSSEN